GARAHRYVHRHHRWAGRNVVVGAERRGVDAPIGAHRRDPCDWARRHAADDQSVGGLGVEAFAIDVDEVVHVALSFYAFVGLARCLKVALPRATSRPVASRTSPSRNTSEALRWVGHAWQYSV